MTLPAIGPSDLLVVVVYLAVLVVPGGLLAALCGVRGWTLAAVAPLATYAIAGLAGPLYAAAGIPWSAGTAALGVVALCAVAGAVGLVVRWRSGPAASEPNVPPWVPLAHAGVAAVVVLATVTGVVAILGGIRFLGAIPQDWDAVFHANGIRYIAETGDGGLYGMATMNWYDSGITVFYPNAYHLVAAAVYQLTGAGIPTVLNAHTVLIPGMFALGLVALIRRAGGRPLMAGAAALLAVSITSFYDMLWRGLLPFAAGVALMPLLVVLGLDLLDARGVRPVLRTAVVFVIGMTGLLCLHPAILISGIVFAAPAFVQRWWRRPAAIPREIGLLAAAGVVAAAACALQLLGSVSSAANLAAIIWPADLTPTEAVRSLLLFGHEAETTQVRLTILLGIGLLFYPRLGALRWVGASAVIFGALFVIAASSDAPWAKQLTSLWWNDRWRLIALAAVPMCVIMAHGVSEVQRLLARLLTMARERWRPSWSARHVTTIAAVTAAAALLVTILGTRGLYLGRDQERMTKNSGNGPSVSYAEIVGMQRVAAIVPPGERVLNDRGDGSVWLYALTGTRSVAAHFDGYRVGPDATLLGNRFNAYPDDPAVRAAVAELNVHYVQLDAGFLRDYASRQPGLTGLDSASWLKLVYANSDLQLYEIVGMPAQPVAVEQR